MNATLLTIPNQQEGLSLVYAKALATRAGFSTSVPYPDMDSVDLCIHDGGLFRPKLDLQLKATIRLRTLLAGNRSFPLPIKNYNELRIPTQTPRLLVVLDLPQDETQWMTIGPDGLVLRHRAYWLSLQNEHDAVFGQKSVTVRIPQSNIFDVDALRMLMDRSRTGGKI